MARHKRVETDEERMDRLCRQHGTKLGLHLFSQSYKQEADLEEREAARKNKNW